MKVQSVKLKSYLLPAQPLRGPMPAKSVITCIRMRSLCNSS